MVTKTTKKVMVTYVTDNGFTSWVDRDLKLGWMLKIIHGGTDEYGEVYILNISKWGAGIFHE